MEKSKNAFTMVELVFVIVVLGILAAVAIPKFSVTRVDAEISKGRADIASIRSAIMTERQSRLIKGDSSYISALSGASGKLFDGNDSTHILLTYGVTSGTSDGHWSGTDPNYTYHVGGKDCTFSYDNSNGKFTLGSTADDNSTICKNLVN